MTCGVAGGRQPSFQTLRSHAERKWASREVFVERICPRRPPPTTEEMETTGALRIRRVARPTILAREIPWRAARRRRRSGRCVLEVLARAADEAGHPRDPGPSSSPPAGILRTCEQREVTVRGAIPAGGFPAESPRPRRFRPPLPRSQCEPSPAPLLLRPTLLAPRLCLVLGASSGDIAESRLPDGLSRARCAEQIQQIVRAGLDGPSWRSTRWGRGAVRGEFGY